MIFQKLKRHFLLFAAFTVLFSVSQTLSAQSQPLEGLELCDYLYDILSGSGLEVQRQDLSITDSYNYPQNLTITLSAENENRQNKNWLDSSINCIIFSFTQNFAAENPNFLLEFIQRLKNLQLSYDSIILLCANDENLDYLEDYSSHPSGTESYVESMGYDDRTCAIIIDKAVTKRTIILGEGNEVAPLWLVRTMNIAFEKKGIDSNLQLTSPLSQKMGLEIPNSRLRPFLQSNIPAAAFSLFSRNDDLDILEYTAATLSDLNKSNWDRHYLFFKVGQEAYWPGEAVFILGFIILSILILIALSFTTFTGTNRSRALARDILRSWFLIPMTIVLSTLLLHLNQFILEGIGVKNPLLFFSSKIIITMLALNALYIIQIRLNFFVSLKASGYLMLFVAAINFFIYSSIEITLLYFFFLEYLLYYIAERCRKTPALIISFILPIIPLAILLVNFLQQGWSPSLLNFLHFSWLKDFIFALTLFPPLMQMNRIWISMDLFTSEKKYPPIKFIAYSLITLFSVFAVGFTFYLVINAFTPAFSKQTEQAHPPISETLEEGILNVDRKTSPFMELTLNEITVSCSEKLIRLSIAVISANETPIYNSNYEYVPFDEKTGSFTFTDYPDGPVTLTYSTEQDAIYSLDISAYTMDQESNIKHRKLSLNCMPEENKD
ncbi:MAG: hypothetical protein J6Y69_06515 [Treponema sp.]|nr:hypothetical protein [Treponema sp.]